MPQISCPSGSGAGSRKSTHSSPPRNFGSSGVRIKARFFAGWDYPPDLVKQKDWVKKAYAGGVPMGGDLTAVPGDTPKGQVPTFAVHAIRDPNSAPLQRIQIIKGWTKDGELYDKVFDVACSDGGKVDPKTHRCPDNGATVDIKTCEISKDKGDAELAATWTDPEFDPDKIPVLFVHGIGGTPLDWKYLAKGLDRHRFQPWFYYYPSGLRLNLVSGLLHEKRQ